LIVVDASALVELVLRTAIGARVDLRLNTPGETLHAPHLVDLEVAQVLRKLVIRRYIDVARGDLALADFLGVRLVRYPHGQMLARIWELRNTISAYDAAYVALAEGLDAPLLTCDRRLAGASGHRAKIEAV